VTRRRHLESGALGGTHHRGDVDELAVGEHVAADEAVPAETGAADPRDRVVQQPPTGSEQRSQRGEVPGHAGFAHVLEHADRRDRVEPLAAERPVVLQPDLDAVIDAGVAHPRPCGGVLLGADGDADDAGAVVVRRVDRHRAPSAADVEESLTRPARESELAAHQIVLRRLGRGEVAGLWTPTCARVGHRRPEHQRVEIVADVVVVRDRLRVTTE